MKSRKRGKPTMNIISDRASSACCAGRAMKGISENVTS
jgi:hypothetical protein